MTKIISLLGSTGSIGRQTLAVARELKLRVAALAAHGSVELIEAQAREFGPRLAVLYDAAAAEELRQRLRDTDIEVLSGSEGLLAAAQAEEADTVVTAVVGSVGLEPTLAAMSPVISPIMESLSTSAMGAMRISAFCAAQRTAFSPVAPRCAPALSMAAVAMALVPTQRSCAPCGKRGRRAEMMARPMPPPCPSRTIMVI